MEKIGFVMNFWRGGGPRNVYTLASYLNEFGYYCKVLSYHSKEDIPTFVRNYYGTLKNEMGTQIIAPKGLTSFINLLFTPSDRLSAFTFVPFKFKEFFLEPRTLRKFENFDFYIATNWQTAYPVYKISREKKSKMLYFCQAYETNFFTNLFWRKYAEKTYELSVTRFTQSKWLKLFLDEKFGGDNVYIGMGINNGFFLEKYEDFQNTIFTIARNDYNKGFDIFVNAVNRLWGKRQDFKVIIAGDSNAITKYQIKFPFDFIGWIDDDSMLARLYSQAIFVNTGRREALPMPPLEAMASGSSVVLTDTDGAKEYTKNGLNCLSIRIDDHVALAEGINMLIDSVDLRRTLRRGGIKTASEYRWDSVVRRLTHVFQNLS
jgi:glycosyltransferase involved in cell wall biosynthesis